MLLGGGLSPGAVAGTDLPLARDPIRERDGAESRARALLEADAVDLEFRMLEAQVGEAAFGKNGFVGPAQQTRVQTRMRGELTESVVWESGLELSLHRQQWWDPARGDQLEQSWRPEYFNRLGYAAWEGGEFSLGQSVVVEPGRDGRAGSEFWRNNIAYKQRLGQLTELKLERGYDTRTSASATTWESQWSAASLSQGLGGPGLRWKSAARHADETAPGADPGKRRVQRGETGLEWQARPNLSLYTGAALEHEERSGWLEQEELLLYEFRTKWSPDPLLDLSAGVAVDGRSEQQEAATSRGRLQLRGELRPAHDLSWAARMQLEQSARSAATGVVQRQDRLFVGSGPSLKLDEGARLGAEYGVARESTFAPAGTGRESLVEHMLSVVLSAEF